MKISALILTKNEEETIEDCLKQLKFVDEIIVLDQNSMDKTAKFAAKYTNRIYHSNETGFDKNRNTLFKLAKYDWLLYLDADERIDEKFVRELKTKIETSKYDVFFVPRKNYVLGKRMKHGGWWPDYVPKIFRKDNFIRWSGEVHESPEFKGDFSYFDTAITHITARNLNLMMEKSIRWAKIEAKLNFQNNASSVSIFTVIKAIFSAFCKRYLIKGGFIDGTIGLVQAIYQALNQSIVLVYLWEMQNESKKVITTSQKQSE